MTLIFHYNLLKDFSTLINNADDYDVIIQVGQGCNTKKFHAHSVILRARCPYFKCALVNWITKEDKMITFDKPNITPTIFNMILMYIYSGELDLTKQSGEELFDLLIASDELFLKELFTHLQEYLIKEKIIWIQQNFNLIFKIVNCKKLQSYCFKTICEVSQPSFPLIDKNILSDILKRDDLQIKEVNIWDYLIKWGIKQTPDIESEENDSIKWNFKNLKKLKKTLESFIPLIRFMSISRTDFFNKVKPYRLIIPIDIYDEIEGFHYLNILPKTRISLPRSDRIDSNIINEEIIVNIFSNLIDRKSADDIRTGNDPFYEFSLIYRGSRDGFDDTSLYNRCNRQVASLVLIEVHHSDKIFGGYSSLGFNSRDYNLKLNHFTFKFEKYKIGNTMNISRAYSDGTPTSRNECGFSFNDEMYMANQVLHLNKRHAYEYKMNYDSDTYVTKEIETFIVTN